jgi:hypothetical protein
MLPRASGGRCMLNDPRSALTRRGTPPPFRPLVRRAPAIMTEVEMQAEPLHQLFPARRAHDRFLRGVVNSVILGVAAWPVIITGVMLIIR